MQNELYYSADQKPPLTTQILLGLQHCLSIASTLAIPLIIFASAGLSLEAQTHLISASLLALGIGTILMSLKTRFLGTAYLCPLLCEPAFLSVSLIAIKLGGPALLFGMILLAGVFQAGFALVYPLIRRFFSTEVSGVVVLMVGFSLVKPDLIYATASSSLETLSFNSANLITAASALLTMLCLVIWNWASLARYCLLIGVIVGATVAYWQGILTSISLHKLIHTPLFAWNLNFTLPTLHFNWDLLLPFVVASIAMTLKGMGGIINCQKINNNNWVRPEQRSIRKGIFTNAIAIIISSLVGGVGLGVANNNIGLSVATKVTSRYVASMTGILLVIFAFIPKIAMLFAIMPKPVIGATLIFVTSYVIVAGIQILSSRMLDTRKIFIIGLSLMSGSMLQIHPNDLAKLPSFLQPILASPIIITTLVAIILNVVLNIGAKSTASLNLASAQHSDKILNTFMQSKGKYWGAIPRLITDATAILQACLQELCALNVTDALQIDFSYTDYALSITICYKGPALSIDTIDKSDSNSQSDLNKTIKRVQESMPELTTHSSVDPQTGDRIVKLNLVQ